MFFRKRIFKRLMFGKYTRLPLSGDTERRREERGERKEEEEEREGRGEGKRREKRGEGMQLSLWLSLFRRQMDGEKVTRETLLPSI